jgi:hypothetical protein
VLQKVLIHTVSMSQILPLARVGGMMTPRLLTGEDTMGWFRSGAVSAVAVLLGLLLVVPAPRAAAQVAADSPPPHKSVYGKLASVDKSRTPSS